MACASFTVPTSTPVVPTTDDIFKQHIGLRPSFSGKSLQDGGCMQRSYSANHLICSVNRIQATCMRRSYSANHLICPVNRIQATATKPKLKNTRSLGIFPFQLSSSMIPNSLRLFLFEPETRNDMSIVEQDTDTENSVDNGKDERKRSNWMERLLQIRRWRKRQQEESVGEDMSCEEDGVGDCECGGEQGGCAADYGSEEEEVGYNRESFSRLLFRVPWSDTKLFSKLAFLCNMAYVIPSIEAIDLKRYYGVQFITSSLEKKAEAAAIKAKLDEDSTRVPQEASALDESSSEKALDSEKEDPIRSSVAYEIAASAASYVQSQTKDVLSLGSEPQQEDDSETSSRNEVQPHKEGENSPRSYKQEVAAYMAASTMTAVVAAGEKEKQQAAKALQSLHSSPCEWFVCDDVSTYTRCFVIQGSDSFASWQANLFFEPTKFEETDVFVHRGIYEAAKGIYEQFMPEILDHLNTHGDRAKLQFIGHSLGGSLSLLVDLMLMIRKVVKPSSLRPVVTFGSPFVFCRGERILDELGLDESHLHCVMMHRDIVPRAFSCNYPDHVAVILKRLNRPLRTYSCLTKNKLLYSPLGKIFILQPDEQTSPSHPLLHPGSAFYALDKTQPGYSANALRTFLNTPHPLETLSDPSAYSSKGTILRDHDSSNYLKALNVILRQPVRKVVREGERRNLMWPLLASSSQHTWEPESSFNKSSFLSKEIMTGV